MSHVDLHTMVIQAERDVRSGRLERQREIHEGLGERRPSRLALVAGTWLSRAGARLQGLPAATLPDGVPAADPTAATA